EVVWVAWPKQVASLAGKSRGQRLHDGHHAEARKPLPEVGRTDHAVLDAVAQEDASGGLDRVAHGLDRPVADCVRRNLQPRLACARDEVLQLAWSRPPDGRGATDRDALGASVDEDLDWPGPNHVAAKPG